MTSFHERFGREPVTSWRAPGRVNLIGEHTDYNGGFVLPMAVPMAVRSDAAPRDDRALHVESAQLPGGRVVVRLDDLRPGSVAGWAAYVAGVAWALHERGSDVRGADLLVDGDVPRGSGLSSSAALECAVAGALLDLAGVDLDPMDVALAAQRAENDYVGMPCGIMDQAASMLCREGHLLLLDCRSLATRHIPFDLGAAGLALLVTDTRAPHRLVDGEYAARRASCEHAARLLGVRDLRDIDVRGLDGALAVLDDDVPRRRVRHVVTENERVLDACRLLEAGEPEAVGPLLDASHESLRVDYEVTCPELDTAAAAARSAGALGARMTGGGFGGSTIALIRADGADAVSAAIAAAFRDAGFGEPVSRVMLPASGAARVLPAAPGRPTTSRILGADAEDDS